MKKDALIGALALLIVSCGGGVEENAVVEQDELISEEPFIAEETDVLTEEESSPIDENSNWQIPEYVDFLVGEEVLLNSESADGYHWFYKTRDVKGGYAKIWGPVEGWEEFAIWRMKDGDDLIGRMVANCGPACEYYFTFYKGKGSEIKEYDQAFLFPQQEIEEQRALKSELIAAEYELDYPEDSEILFNLPQSGTGMRVDLVMGADEVQVPILFMSWDKTAFSVSEIYEGIEAVD